METLALSRIVVVSVSTDGITRIVVLVGRWAIKLPRWNYGWGKFVEGVTNNRSEWAYWRKTKSNEVCPTLFSFWGLFNIMPRVRICESKEEIECIPLDDWLDRKPDNLGHYKEKIVWVDYPYHITKNEAN